MAFDDTCPVCAQPTQREAVWVFKRCLACEGAWRKEHPEVRIAPDPARAELLLWLMRNRGAANK